tara:strand:- start:840 stop:1016 length:177 start_codon:yes stop_codon:yes gene_type:complete
MGAEEMNAQLLLGVEDCLSMTDSEWAKHCRFWFDGRCDEFGESSALLSLIFYSFIRSK